MGHLKAIARRLGYDIRRHREPVDVFAIQSVFTRNAEPIIFDVGAHDGATAGRYRAMFPRARIYCFEANPALARTIEARFHDDALIKVVPVAVADTPGRRPFLIHDFAATSSLLPRSKDARRYNAKDSRVRATEDVEAVTLDQVADHQNIEYVDLLKLDIQGAELVAISGARRLLEAQRVGVIRTEVLFAPHYEGGASAWAQGAALEAHGYSIFGLYDCVSGANGQLRYADALFVSKAIRSETIDVAPEEA